MACRRYLKELQLKSSFLLKLNITTWGEGGWGVANHPSKVSFRLILPNFLISRSNLPEAFDVSLSEFRMLFDAKFHYDVIMDDATKTGVK